MHYRYKEDIQVKQLSCDIIHNHENLQIYNISYDVHNLNTVEH